MSELSLAQLRCFVAVADAGSFAAAGRQLAMSTSAMSKTVSRFEAARGLKLFHRSTHALSLTEAGELLVGPAREAIQGVAAAEAAFSDLAIPGTAGRVRISAAVGLMRRRIVPLLPAFAAACPDIHLDLRASNERVDLAADGIDIAVRGGPLDGLSGHLSQPWFTYRWVACATPGYVQRHGMPATPGDLEAHTLIGFRNRHTGAIRPWRLHSSSDAGEALSVTPHARFTIDDGESAWTAGLLGVGIVMAPLWLAVDALVSGEMVAVLHGWRGEETSVSLVRRDRRHGAQRVDAVIAFLRQHAPMFPAHLAV